MMNEQTPTRRRPHEPSNNELLASIVSDDQRRSSNDHAEDSSKSRRSLHWEMGPFVLSGAAFDRLQARFTNVTTKLTLDTLRPLPLFIGVSGPAFCFAPDAFTPPISLRQIDKSSIAKFKSRVSRNLSFFATNYAFLSIATFLVVALMHVRMLVFVAATYAMWWLHFTIIKQDVKLAVMGRDLNDLLTPRGRANLLTLWTLWVAIARCLKPSMKGMAIACFLILFHALMRDPSKLAADLISTHPRTALRSGGSDSEDDGSTVVVDRPPADAV
mmetsp:Transcript_29230/g.66616  ORF Transcript_29230/g.66616 Transcript_29230/m.66616 type:complete len:272 (+) Transcript_29230:283-1098(+)